MTEQTNASKKALPLAAALGSYVLAWAYVSMIFADNGGWRWWLGAFALGFVLLAEYIFRRCGKLTAPKESRFWLGCVAVLLARAVLVDILPPLLVGEDGGWEATSNYALPALHLVAVYWVLCRADALVAGETSGFVWLDGLYGFFGAPFGNFLLRIQTVFGGVKEKLQNRHTTVGEDDEAITEARREKRNAFWIGGTILLVALMLFRFAAATLYSADVGFAAMLDSLSSLLEWHMPALWGQWAWRFLLSLPVGAWLFGLMGGAARRTESLVSAERWQQTEKKLHVAPGGTFVAVLCGFCALYLLFFFVQAGYIFGALTGNLPEGFTASEYARQGFFQLCQIQVLNFGLLLAVLRLGKKSLCAPGTLRWAAWALLAENLLFTITAAAKIVLYIHRFGFTALRLESSWLTLVLAVWTVLAALRLQKEVPAVKWGIWFAAASGCVLVWL